MSHHSPVDLSNQKQFQKINLGDSVKVPSSVATCPECWSQLLAEVVEYGVESGRITEGGLYVSCENAYDPTENPEGIAHEYSGLEGWNEINYAVWNWVFDNVRVVDASS